MKRLFQGLRRTEPASSYDAVVLGAGIGGLVCANLLAREGLRTLLVEQHYMVGGYCSTFRRRGFTFDAATHFYPLLGNRKTLTGKLLVDLGVETRWVKMDPVDTFHFPDGTSFQVPADFAAYRRRLDREFPHQSLALDRFFAQARQAYRRGLLCYFRDRDSRLLGPYHRLTVRQVLDRHFDDPKLKLLLTGDSPHWGSPPGRISFVFDAMLRLAYFQGNYYPVGGSQAFADELARRFEERGGHLLMSTRGRRIVVRDGRVRGVWLETLRGPLRGRRQISADTVVSNGDLRQTVERLLPARHVDVAYRESVARLRPSYPCFLTHIGLRDIPGRDLAAAQGHHWRSWDPDEAGRGGLCCKVFAPTLYEPRMAPPGGHVVILQKTLAMDYAAIRDWPAHKRAVEENLLAHLEEVLPGVSKRVVVKTSASAYTSYRFTLNHAGSMLGWEMTPDQLGESRPANEGPVPGLYLVGHWTRPGGGITPVMVSALRVAAAIAGLERWRPCPGDVAGSSVFSLSVPPSRKLPVEGLPTLLSPPEFRHGVPT